jgi:hypothetical protein
MASRLCAPVGRDSSDPWNIACDVLAHAVARWGHDGWEVVAECWLPLDIVLVVHRRGLHDTQTAIAHFDKLACEGVRPACQAGPSRTAVLQGAQL